jgi:hypothetical protein
MPTRSPRHALLSTVLRPLHAPRFMTWGRAPLAALICLGVLSLPPAARTVGARPAPACQSANPRVAVPRAPHGLFVADANAPQAPSVRVLSRYLSSDPTLCGASLIVPWSAIDRGPGHTPRYDWHFVDSAAKLWIVSGKMINLNIWGVAEHTSQQFGGPMTPAYVLRRVHTITCPGPNHPATPIYWEPGYQDNYRAFMRAAVQHYGHDPAVGYIRFGIGAGGKDVPAADLRGPCLHEWVRHGLSAQRWQQYSLSTIRFERTLHSPKQLMVSLNQLQGVSNLTLPRAVAAQAVQAGLGLGIQEWTQGSGQQTRAAHPCYADWCALFQRYAGRVPLALQASRPSNPAGTGSSASLIALLRFGLRQEHAQIIELYPQEWLVANDPSYPGYAQYHALYAAALTAVARRVNHPCQPLPGPTGSSGSARPFVATPLTDLGSRTYKGFTGGLYPHGRNTVPPDQAAAGLVRAGRIRPLDRDGRPNSTGKIVLLSISMSNGAAEWCGTTICTMPSAQSFMGQAAADPAVNHQTLAIINGARGGQDASRWTSPRSSAYDVVRDQQLAPQGLSEKQVQVIWLKEANARPRTALPSPSADAYTLETELGDILRALRVRYPHLQEVFLSSRIYGGYAISPLNPEPYAYEGGFSVKWVIQAQIQQMRNGGAVVDARAGDMNDTTVAPWVAWGPYLWADGTRPRSDGLIWQRSDFRADGTHPSPAGVAKVGSALLRFFLDSPFTRCWFRAPAQHAACTLSSAPSR